MRPSWEARTDPGQRYWSPRGGPLQAFAGADVGGRGCFHVAFFGYTELAPTSLSRRFKLHSKPASCSLNLLARSGSWWTQGPIVCVPSTDPLNLPFPGTNEQTSN